MKHVIHEFNTLILIMCISVITSCGDDQSEDTSTQVIRPVKTTVISAGDLFTGREFTGVVDAYQTAELGFQIGGRLQELNVKEGDEIQLGQVIAELDATDIRLKLENSQASYNKAEADFKRADELIKGGFISQADYDNLEAAYTSARTQLAASQQELAYTKLIAPFSGIIAERHVDNFVVIQAKQPVVTLQDLSMIAIKIDIPESIMIRIDRNNENRKMYAMFESLGDIRYPLTLKEVSTRSDPQTQTFEVTLSMPTPEDKLILPGMTTTVIGEPGNTAASSIILPPQSVLEDSRGRFVYIASPQAGDEATIARREVQTGILNEQGLEVTSGLEQGEHVVTAGMSKITEGMRVRLMNAN